MQFTVSPDGVHNGTVFDRIFNDYHRQMEYVAFSVLQNRQDAEDAVQEAFISLSSHIELLSQMEEFRIYYYVTETARHKAIDMLRSRKNNLIYDDAFDFISPDGDFTEKLAAKDSAQIMVTYIKQLPEKYRDVLALCYVNGLNANEIAEIVGRSSSTVRKQIERGRMILLKRWKENNDG